MLHRFEIFSAPGTIAHDSIRLPSRSLVGNYNVKRLIFTYISPCLNSLKSLLQAVWRHHVNKEIMNFTRTKSSYLPPTLPHTLPPTLGQGRLKRIPQPQP